MKSFQFEQAAYERGRSLSPEADASALRRTIGNLAQDRQAVIVCEDDTTLAAFATSYAVETLIDAAGWNPEQLTGIQINVTWQLIRLFAASLCDRLEADSKIVTMYAAMWVFRNDNRYVYGSEVLEINLHVPGSHGILERQYQQLTKNFETWINRRDAISTARLTRLVRKLAMSFEGSLRTPK